MAFSSFDSDQDPLESKPMADINVTPMVDVMLVLLVIFMVAAPLMTGSVPVDLPKGTRAQKSVKEAPLILTLDVQKKLYVGKKHVAKEQLADALGPLDKNKRVYLKADRRLSYGEVMTLMDDLQSLGYSLALLSETKKPAARR